MFEYFNRKFKSISFITKVPSRTINSIIEEESESTDIRIFTTRNPFFCYKDSSLNAEYLPNTHTIQVCTNLLKSPEDLRGILRREIAWSNSHNSVLSDDESARLLISSCKAETGAIPSLDPATRELATELCAKFYIKHKLQNSGRHMDSWHFYTRFLIDSNWYCYN